MRVLALDDGDVGGVLGLEALENGLEHAVDGLHDFVVVLLESHLEIEADELGHVAVGVGVLGAEDWRRVGIVSKGREDGEEEDGPGAIS